MKKAILSIGILTIGLGAQAIDCVVRDTSGAEYEITRLASGAVDVVTDGAGWILEPDVQQSTATTKYFSFKRLLLVSENETVSIYDYQSQIYYFEKERCSLPSSTPMPQTQAPPPGFKPHFQGAMGLANGAQIAPLPGGPNGPYFDVNASFTRKRSIRNQEQFGIACDFDPTLQASFCDTRDYYIIAYADRVELTIKSQNSQYMLPLQKGISCSNIGLFCEALYAIDRSAMSVGQGHTSGLQLMVTVNGSKQEFNFEYAKFWDQ